MCKVGKLFVLMMSTAFLSFAPAVVWAGELPGEPQAFGQSVSDSALDLVEDDGRDHGSILIETNLLPGQAERMKVPTTWTGVYIHAKTGQQRLPQLSR